MASRWTVEKQNTLVSLLVDGVSMQSLSEAIPNRTVDAIATRARKQSLGLNFRTSTRDGRLYEGVSRRDRTHREEALNAIAGEPRTTQIVQEPTTSETITTASDESIAENPSSYKPINGLIAYRKAWKMLQGNDLRPDHEMVFYVYIEYRGHICLQYPCFQLKKE